MRYKVYLIVWTIALTVLFYLTSHARADDVYSFYGGPGIVGAQPTGSTKMFGLRYETHEIRGIYSAYDLGYWSDQLGEGRKSSLVGKYQLGILPGAGTGVYGKAFLGPCIISTPDTALGGRFPQFCTDVGVGVRDSTTMMGVGYSHVSSAGLVRPNRGRDYVVISIGLRF